MEFGINRNGTPKTVLSYSALHKWTTDKDGYRRLYYEGIKPPASAYMLFGREVHERIENDPKFKMVPRFSKREHKIITKVDGIPVLGYLDGFAPRVRSFVDYKSGIRKADGSARWNAVEVQRLKQLPFYSLLIENFYGSVHPTCTVVWLETAWEDNTQLERGSTKLTTGKPELTLTGHTEIFKRHIHDWERENIREWIITNAHDIANDYKTWKKTRK